MNRKNIWIHISLATILVAMAAVLGQIERWKSALRVPTPNTVHTKKSVPLNVVSTKDDTPELFVRFKPGVTLDRIRELASARHDVMLDEIESVPGLIEINDLDNATYEAVAAQYAGMPEVLYVAPNPAISLGDDPIQKQADLRPVVKDLLDRRLAKTAGMPNDPMFDQQWAHNNPRQDGGKDRADLDSLNAWLKTQGSDEVVIAVLDSGVDYNHEDLVENMWTRPESIPEYADDELGTYNDIKGFNGTDKIADPMDDNGHGTHCAGIIGAEGDNGKGVTGINWKVKIMPLKFLGRGGFGTTDDAIEAINYAIDRKKKGVNLRVISASWGSNSYSKALEDTIRAAGDAGILFVAAAGNDGSSNDKRHHYPSDYQLPNVISVAALDRNDQLASFSNWGVKSVHVAAPGKEILSTWLGDDYREASGTSMATPYVSGVAALIIADSPDISMEQLRARILGSVDKLDSLKGKVESGGRICAANALAGTKTH